jgi:hypothetical protein
MTREQFEKPLLLRHKSAKPSEHLGLVLDLVNNGKSATPSRISHAPLIRATMPPIIPTPKHLESKLEMVSEYRMGGMICCPGS